MAMLMRPNSAEEFARDIPTAIRHLNGLAKRIKDSKLSFQTKDVENIDVIIDAINELEIQRAYIHDQLEAETIKCSILRHELKVLPEAYRKEIHDAVVNARSSNKSLVVTLNKTLRDTEESTVELTRKQEDLEASNAKLLPERDQLREQHEQVITSLNIRMAEKAAKQIQLNETRDRLRATNRKILDYEDDLLNLKEDMIKERAEARGIKSNLQAQINAAREQMNHQNKENDEAKAQLDQLLKRQEHTEKELDELRAVQSNSDMNRATSEGQERALNSQINKQLRDNDSLRKSILDTQRKKIEVKQKYERDIENMQKAVEKLQSQIKVKEERHGKLNIRAQDLRQDSSLVEERLTESQKQVEEVTAVLNGDAFFTTNVEFKSDDQNSLSQNQRLSLVEAKQSLVHKQEDVARLRAENSRMEEEIVELGETHKVVVENFNRQIDEYREQLGKERKERMEVQAKRDNVQKNLDDFKQSNNRYMASINKKVSQGKQAHDDLTNEGQELQRNIKKLDETIKAAKVTARTERVNYETKKVELEEKLVSLKTEISTFEDLTSQAKEIMEMKAPEFDRQKEEFAEVKAHFEDVKKKMTGMKSQRAGLEDQVKRTRVAIEKQTKPQPEVKRDIAKIRKITMNTMKTQLQETEELEREMYVVGTKMQTIADENQRFVDGNTDFSADMAKLTAEEDTYREEIAHLRDEYKLLKCLMYTAWGEDNQREKEFSERDEEILEELAGVLKISSRRTDVVTQVNSNLTKELEGLTDFLQDVSGRRPKVDETDTAMNTRGTQLQVRGSQPSKRFLERQAKIDKLSIIIPDTDESRDLHPANVLPQSPTQDTDVERLKQASRDFGQLYKIVGSPSVKKQQSSFTGSKTPLPPIGNPETASTQKSAISSQ